ncbi:ABC transporter permease [Thermomonospora cellulosilytica]|uniref:ABC-2 type transport system permease protein n=1 Tax=Thermomonospora cellulosilytica TaxID=1411118 RepID=A0A7W3N0Z8_9ACTN|nr:ABC-2 family transporter protein [Thermomonospora cellulosilytica]MBA9005479.1 ABC-2 type transport system permease protein [Thermomonospora cellulosilytica]
MADALRLYALLAWTWMRAAAQYPVSMLLLGLATATVAALDLAGILLLFAHTPRIAGFTAEEVLFLYGTSAMSFVIADTLLGTTERLGEHVRQGTLDTMLVRPVGPLVQIATEDFSPRRMSKLLPPAVVLAVVLPRLPVDWTPGRIAMVPVMLASGVVIFAAIWVLTASVQFVVIEVHPATKSVTYGGAFLTQYPMTLYAREFVRGMTFVVPLAFVNWQPGLYVLGRPDPLGLPEALRLASPAVAVLLSAAAALAWRSGLRHYRSTGS